MEVEEQLRFSRVRQKFEQEILVQNDLDKRLIDENPSLENNALPNDYPSPKQ